MPKKAYKIEDFSGGINQLADPRDIQDNQFEELFNADVSRIGRITLPGNALEPYQTTNVKNKIVSPDNSDGYHFVNTNQGLTPGYGLFSFSHDFNMRGINDVVNDKRSTDFLCLNDGAHIDIWDSCNDETDGSPSWINGAIKLGEAHAVGDPNDVQFSEKVKPTYYMAGSGLRACDGQFCEQDTNANTTISTATATSIVTLNDADGNNVPHGLLIGEYVRVNNEIMLVSSITNTTTFVAKRGQFGTTATSHTDSSIFRINVPKVLTHVNRPMLEKAGANVNINRWVEDIQAPEKPDPGALSFFQNGKIISSSSSTVLAGSIYPSEPEKVFMGIIEAVDDNEEFSINDDGSSGTQTTQESGNSSESIMNIPIYSKLTGALPTDFPGPFSIGKAVIISGCSGDVSSLNGVFEIVGLGSDVIKIAAEKPATITQSGFSEATVTLEGEVVSDDLKNKYILGISYAYQGGGNEIQESDITIANMHTNIIPQQQSVFKSIGVTNNIWRTAGTDGTYDADLLNDGTDGENMQLKNGGVVVNNATNKHLGFITTGITNAADYYVSVNVSSYTDGAAIVAVGQNGNGAEHLEISSAGTHTAKIAAGSTSTIGVSIKFVDKDGNAPSLTINSVQVWKDVTNEMSATNALDLRDLESAAKSSIAFLCNNSRTASAQNNSWNERIEGFKIYMKQVDMMGEGLAEDFLLLYDVSLKNGTYVCHGKDGDKETLRLGDISGNVWASTHDSGDSATVIDQKALVTSNLNGDTIKSIPLLSYESENGYPAGTNLAAMYKTSATIQRKVYIGNLKIGNRTYPDRMMRADADKFDTFPDDGTHFIDVATADGDSIVKLESFGDKLIQYKEKTSFLIKVTSEGEELLETWQGAGVLSPSQVVKTNKGVVWANSNGLYLYDGEKLSQVSEDRFKSEEWSINENKETPVILGYHENSNKVIIQTLNNTATDSGGFIYDLSTGAIIQCQKLFKWYISQSVDDLDVDIVTGTPKVSPPLIVTSGEGPLA